jgi:ABC-2 type transport system ATP-binding protein
MEPSIRLRGVTKHFRTGAETAVAVAGIDLDIGPGEVVALLGPNGAGKTTTLDMILGFVKPTDGQVTLFGRPPRCAVEEGRVSAVLQTGGLLRDLTVGETVELIASTYADTQPSSVIERAGLGKLVDRQVQLCSGGEQQRLRFALALLADPDLLLLDEPTAGMDVTARQEFWATMSAEADRGRTIVFATHYLQEAEDFARRTVLMADGHIVADGPTEQVRWQAAGRTLLARVDPDRIASVSADLEARGLVSQTVIEGDRLTVEAADSDLVARVLLSELDASDLEIRPASLQTAFIRLTSTSARASVDA